MGGAASIEASLEIDLTKAKELVGESWNEALENRFNSTISAKGTNSMTIKELKFLAPQLFTEDMMTVDELAEIILIGNGSIWNDELTTIFESIAKDVEVSTQTPTKTENGATEENAGEIIKDNANEVKMNRVVNLSEFAALTPTLFETAADRKKRLDAEFQSLLARRADGMVTINYQMYNEQFPIAGNTLTAARIDEDYGLTDVMPNCRIRLSQMDSATRTLYANAHPERAEAPWVREDPEGTFKDLLADETYYCIVIEDAAQYAKDMLEMKAKLGDVVVEEGGAREEGCSCLYGNPCVDQYICKNWDSRFAVAKANGWKGF